MYRSQAETVRTIAKRLISRSREVKNELGAFDLIQYARDHRLRLRNLHDGHPLPPAISRARRLTRRGYTGAKDRLDAIVGRNGYVAQDGDMLSAFLFFKSAKGVGLAVRRLRSIGARIEHVGDTEVDASASPDQTEQALAMIKVSRLKTGDVTRFRPHT